MIANKFPAMSDESDEFLPTRVSLLGRLKDWGDQRSWQDFYDTYHRLIHSVALKAGLTPTEAQDVVQETVLSVTKKIGDFRADPARGSFKGWLSRRVKNLRCTYRHPFSGFYPGQGSGR